MAIIDCGAERGADDGDERGARGYKPAARAIATLAPRT